MDSNTIEGKKRKVLSDGFKKAVGQMIKEKHFKSAQAFADFLDDNGCRAAGCEIGNRIYSWTGNKTSLPDIVTLVEIAKVCGCSVDFLLGLSDRHTVNNALISQETGLNDAAIETLKFLDGSVNWMIASDEFRKYCVEYVRLFAYYLANVASKLNVFDNGQSAVMTELINRIDFISVARTRIQDAEKAVFDMRIEEFDRLLFENGKLSIEALDILKEESEKKLQSLQEEEKTLSFF